MVEKWTCLNVLDKEIFEGDPKILTEEKSWRTWKSNQNIVMDEELVENVAMGEKSVKNFVMGANFDPKVEMDLSIFEIGGWKNCNSVTESCWENSLRKRQLKHCLLDFFKAENHFPRCTTR